MPACKAFPTRLACEKFIGKDVRGTAVWKKASGTTKQQGVCEAGGSIMGRPLTFPSAAREGSEGHSLVGVLSTPSFVQVSRREQGQSGPA